MKNDPYLKKVSPLPPMVAFRRTTNLRNKLIKSKVPPPPPKRKKRELPGMKKCNKPGCGACPLILEGKEVKSIFNATSVEINCPVNCETQNVVYGIFARKKTVSKFILVK